MMEPADNELSHSDQISRLRLIRSSNIGPATYRQLLSRYGDAQSALDALPTLTKTGGKRKIVLCSKADAEREFEQLAKLGGRFLFDGQSDYPAQLAATEDAPPVLTTLGDTSLLSQTTVGIVGARNASAAGRKLARRFAEVLGDAGFIIASGLARGIDAAAHDGSMKSGTVAVFAGGIDVIYPKEHDKLAAAIRQNGVIVSETPLGTRPQARHFPRRNRIISGLSAGVLVVEAALKSGSLITAQFAADQGRDVFAVPGSPLDPRCRGCNDLIRKGAWITETPDDIFRALSGFSLPTPARLSQDTARPQTTSAPSMETASVHSGSAEEKIVEALSHTPVQVDELIRAVSLSAATVQESLLSLELSGQLARHPGGYVSLMK